MQLNFKFRYFSEFIFWILINRFLSLLIYNIFLTSIEMTNIKVVKALIIKAHQRSKLPLRLNWCFLPFFRINKQHRWCGISLQQDSSEESNIRSCGSCFQCHQRTSCQSSETLQNTSGEHSFMKLIILLQNTHITRTCIFQW